MGQGRSKSISESQFVGKVGGLVGSATFVHDLIEFWIAGVIGLAIFGSIVVTVVHGGLPWECEEHVKLVSGSADLGFNMNHTSGADASHYECEYMTSTGAFAGAAGGGMCAHSQGATICDDTLKKTICNAHSLSLGCKWYKATDKLGNDAQAEDWTTPNDPARNWELCQATLQTDSTNAIGADAQADKGCCLYNAPTTDDQLHDVCYSIDQYTKDEHYPNFVGKYKKQVEGARTFAILGYGFGFAAFAARVVYHVPLLSNAIGGADYQKSRDYWVRLADLAFLITAFIFTILTFTELDDVLMDNRKHLWGTEGVFKTKAHQDAVEEQLVAGTGFYAVAVYATLLGVNVVWFLGTQVGIIPPHPTHQAGEGVELRGIAFRAEHA